MDKTIANADVQLQLEHILDEVAGAGARYVIERNGEPVAAVVPIHVYEQWKNARDAFFDRIAEIAKRADMNEDEAMALALEAQQSVRAGRRQLGA
jgi:prevent-host-death family protein